MSLKTKRLFETAGDFDLCNGLFLRIGDEYGHEIVADKYTPEERVVMLVWHAGGIVDNGGFEYLFSGDLPGDPGFRLTLEAFEQVGCSEAAAAFRDAISIFPRAQVPADVDIRMKLFKQHPEAQRHSINQRFWRADWEDRGEQRLRHKLAGYIRSHKVAFSHL